MRLAIAAAVVVIGCSSKKAPPTPETSPAPPALPRPVAEAAAASTPRPRESERPSDAKKHRISLRSTPSGADVAVDGKPVGSTPTVTDIEADGRAREYTFTLPGHEIARYRFPATRDGVVHGTLKPLAAAPDAGP